MPASSISRRPKVPWNPGFEGRDDMDAAYQVDGKTIARRCSRVKGIRRTTIRYVVNRRSSFRRSWLMVLAPDLAKHVPHSGLVGRPQSRVDPARLALRRRRGPNATRRRNDPGASSSPLAAASTAPSSASGPGAGRVRGRQPERHSNRKITVDDDSLRHGNGPHHVANDVAVELVHRFKDLIHRRFFQVHT